MNHHSILRFLFLILLLFVLLNHLAHNSAILSYQTIDFLTPINNSLPIPHVLNPNSTFSNTPLSNTRSNPSNFASSTAHSLFAPTIYSPLLTIITISKDPRPVFIKTAHAIRLQTLRPIRWLLVNDHSQSSISYQRLKHVALQDPRVKLLNSTNKPGFCQGRLFALNYLIDNPTPYFAFLDDDDLFELTYYEKCIWMLTSTSAPSMCGSHVVGFGENNYTWTYGFHSGMKAALNNPLTGSEVLRTSVLSTTGCRFDPNLDTGMEDWEFYLCLASRGAWGATIPEPLVWYRQNPEALRRKRWSSLFDHKDKTGAVIRARYAKLASASFPRITVPGVTELEPINVTLPFHNRLIPSRTALLLTSWLAPGETTVANLRLIKLLRAAGFRVTVVCTLHDTGGVHAQTWRTSFLRYTSDIFFLPAMLRLPDFPRFLAYLIESRGVSTVVLSHSRLAYGTLPWMARRFARTTFVDFVLSQEHGFRHGAYLALSALHSASLDRTLVPDDITRKTLVERGRPERDVSILGDGFDMSVAPMHAETRVVNRRAVGLALDAVVVTVFLDTSRGLNIDTVLKGFAGAVTELREKSNNLKISRQYKIVLLGDVTMHGGHWRLVGSLHRDVISASSKGIEIGRQYVAAADTLCFPTERGDMAVIAGDKVAFDGSRHVHSQNGLVQALKYDGGAKIVTVKSATDEVLNAFSKFLRDGMASVQNARIIAEPMHEQKEMVPSGWDKVRVRQLEGAMVRLRRMAGRDGSGGESENLQQLQSAQSEIVRELRDLSDFGVAQNTLQGKPRGEFGTEYRAKCGEYDEVYTRLIDLLERPKSCIEGEQIEIGRMQRNAIEQCGRWCIMDNRDERWKSGWHVIERCGGVERFDNAEHKCSLWYREVKSG